MENTETLIKLKEKFGSDGTIVSLDFRRNEVMKNAWTKSSNLTIFEAIKKIENLGLKRILVTSISKDGTLEGPDLSSIRKIKEETKLSIIAAGGVSSLEDIKNISKIGVEALVIGKAFYKNLFSLREALKVISNVG